MQIEVGKCYRDGLGHKVGPMFRVHSLTHPMRGARRGPHETFGQEFGYTASGRWISDHETCRRDLVEEWKDSEPATADAPEEAQPDYGPLRAILDEAYQQAAAGKGKERHARGQDFIDQPTMEIGRMVGLGYPIGQLMKKGQEAVGMVNRGKSDAAVAELLGVINYAVAAVILIREGSVDP